MLMEPRATLGIYDAGDDHFTCYTTKPEPASCPAGDERLLHMSRRRTKLRVIAPDGRRWLRLQDFHLSGRDRLSVGLEAYRRAGEMDRGPHRGLPDGRARPRPVSTVKMAFDSSKSVTALKVDTIANLGAYMSLFSSCCRPILYATLLSGQYAIPAIHANVRTVYTNRRGSTLSRRRAAEATHTSGAHDRDGRAELGVSPAELRRINSSATFPHRRR